MPDLQVLNSKPDSIPALALDWAGIVDVELPVQLNYQGCFKQLAAQAQILLSLDDTQARGLNMTELYSIAESKLSQHEFSFVLLKDLVTSLLGSHSAVSNNAKVIFSFVLPVKNLSLVSQVASWRNYSITMGCVTEAQNTYYVFAFDLLYSSTCPCSASFADQANKDNAGQGFTAVPHSQKSRAKIKLSFEQEQSLDSCMALIHKLENQLGTSVQAAVQAQDEYQMTINNGKNLIFVEDAARKLKSCLAQETWLLDFSIELKHYESIHPHNGAVFC